MQNSKFLVAIAEDKKEDLKMILKAFRDLNNYKVIITATGGQDLIKQLDVVKKLPDLILMDMQMPCCDGLLATIICRRLFEVCKIVGLSTHTNSNVINQFMAEGGSGFLSKFIVAKDSAICMQTYKEPNFFEKALDKIMIEKEVYFDPMCHYNGEDYKKLNSTFKIIVKKFKDLTSTLISVLQLNAAGFKQLEIVKLLKIGVSTLNKYLSKLRKYFDAKSNKDLINLTAMLGITKNVTLYQQFGD